MTICTRLLLLGWIIGLSAPRVVPAVAHSTTTQPLIISTTKGARVPVRLVRDGGVALSVDGAVDTPAGRAWMEVDIGNLGSILVGEHVAASLGLSATETDRQPADFALADGIPVRGPARVGRLIMDGDIGRSVLRRWDITLDLANGRAWFEPAAARGRRC